MNFKQKLIGSLAMVLASTSMAAGFVNGGFDNGTTSGWTIGGGFRNYQTLGSLNPSDYVPGGSSYDASIANSHSAVVNPGLDPNNGSLMPNVVYSGAHSLRVEDTISGGYLSVAAQTVTNYTEPNIFFTWLAVLEGAHDASTAAALVIQLKDVTLGDVLISRQYSAVTGTGGVDARFTYNSNTGDYYTSQWQIEQLTIDASRQGHTFELIVLASDCGPTGHSGYAYLDGFGSVTPPTSLPEPASLALSGVALLGLAAARRRRQG